MIKTKIYSFINLTAHSFMLQVDLEIIRYCAVAAHDEHTAAYHSLLNTIG